MGNPLSKKLDETLRYYAGKYGLSSEVLDEIAAASGALTDAATALAAVASAQTAATAAGASAQAAQTTASAALSLASAAQSVANAAESAANTLAAAVADAQTAANTAQTAASTAQTAASTAQSTANTAQSAAATAQSAASAAQSTANVAQIAAAAAQTGADGAQTSANAAQTSSSTAQSTANAAQSAAAVAQTAASTAQSTANGAATAASTAQTTATAAATAASTAQTTATAAATAASTAQTTATAAATAASTAQSTANAASAAAAALTASNGGSKPLWLLPALPHADDEEFDTGPTATWVQRYTDGSNINLGVTLSVTATDPYAALTANTGRVEYGRRSSWMHLQVNSGFFPSVFCKKPVSIATNCLIWARMGALHRAASEERYQMAGITITGELAGQPDPLNRISCGLNDYAGNRVYVGSKFIAGGETVYPSGGGNSLTNNGAAPYPYLAIHKIGTTYHFWALSEDGARTYMGTTTFAPAVAWIGFYDSSGGTQGNPGTPIICADFLRRLDTATFPF